ncbi:MFS transporter [Nocardiopsis gilva YIM 90087]|uniref:MFS transporter n=1 Tax=Nocardiopsis gilva YIM 90087 TaxID=1235441 RepID=A0A223S1V8_9ACTN|nr:MFS transporter [Nocardiopsis gilva]ASU82057.1 MFS transporter [Nocardiopsis gilva YIM 90087]
MPRTSPEPCTDAGGTPPRLAPSAETPAPAYAPLARSITAFVLTALLATGQLYAVIPLMDQLADDWNTPATSMTWMASAFGFGYAGGFVLFGPLSERYGHRRVIVAGLAATAITTAFIAAAPGFGTAVALRVLQGIATAAFPPTVLAYIAQRIAPSRRALTTAAVTTSFLASAVVGQLAAQTIGDALGWRAVFLASAAGFAAMAVILLLVMLPHPRGGTASPLEAYRAIPALLRAPRLRLLYAATPAVFGSFVAVYTGIQLSGIVTDPRDLVALRASALPVMVAVPLLTPWLSRIRSDVRVTLAMLLSAVALLVIGVMSPGSTAMAVLLMAFAAGITITAPAMLQTVGARTDTALSTAISLSTFWFFVGASLGPQLAAVVTPHGFDVLLYTLATVLTVGAALVLASQERSR